MIQQESDSDCLVEQLRQEPDQEALASLFSKYRGRLKRLIDFRMDRRLARRVDSSDVMQQVYVEAQSRLRHFASNPALSFYGWLRQITLQTLVDVHRRHLGTKKRDAKQEVSLFAQLNTQSAAQSLAQQLADSLTSPSQAAVKREMVGQLRGVIESMDEIDREVLILRHFEEMGNNEVAEVLGIGEAAASNRYVRALKRLRDMLGSNEASSS